MLLARFCYWKLIAALSQPLLCDLSFVLELLLTWIRLCFFSRVSAGHSLHTGELHM